MSVRLRSLFLLLVLVFTAIHAFAKEGQQDLAIGDPFPDLTIPELLDPADYAALGLEDRRSGPFSLSEIPGELLLLEFFNRYCNSCQRHAPSLQNFYEEIRKGDDPAIDPTIKRVRLLAVGVGNSAPGLTDFRRTYGARYPLAADPYFEVYYALGDLGGTPYAFFLKREEGRTGWTLADHHMGVQSTEELLATTQTLRKGAQGPAAAYALPVGSPPGAKLALDPEETAENARKVLTRAAGREVAVRRVELGEDVMVYEALADGTQLGLYALVTQRPPVCDLCHTILFALAFDKGGVLRGFLPLYVTKYGNEVWDEEDAAQLSHRLVGRAMEGLTFDPEVDAVTRATMSSTLIFDEARRAAALLERLK